MFQTYEEALEWIHSRLRLGIKPGLSRMEWMLKKMGHPEKKLKAIHVGGTNGKGSTVAYLRSVLIEAGYQVGSFTSPYIEQFNERISVNGIPIPDEDIMRLVNVIKPLADELDRTELGSPTEFEVITAMALYYFAEMQPMDFTIFEVGLGGRYDSTNVVEPLVSIITNIGMDHTQILGNTIEEIAYEKAGIIKKNTPVFTAVKDENAIKVLQNEVLKKDTVLYGLGTDFMISDYQSTPFGEQFSYSSAARSFENLEISLLGQHQTENAAGAVAALLYLTKKGFAEVEESEIRSGFKKAYWPGRMELLNNDPIILIDGAHNPEGLRAFAAAIKTRYAKKKLKLVFAALKDKDVTDMFTIINGMNAQLYVTEFDFPRAAAAKELKSVSQNPSVIANADWTDLLGELTHTLRSGEILAVTGSLYFISTIKPYLQKIIAEMDKH